MLDNDYYFYIAFENSVCKDYITEKLWNQGYQRNIIPIVLKRSIVEPYVPPKSFVAVDDYATLEDLATELFRIMNDKALYVSYFEWRRSYKVIFLDGEVHDTLERPWGFCQLCRLAHQEPRPKLVMGDFNESWKESCEKDGELVFRFLKTTNPRQSIRNYQALRLKAKIVESALKIT
ncbi:hypothetical protein L596_002184 [Steinernema carpocapsae]|nr:hypothetical protein L596_002184 [Steinernema carpocapsae]